MTRFALTRWQPIARGTAAIALVSFTVAATFVNAWPKPAIRTARTPIREAITGRPGSIRPFHVAKETNTGRPVRATTLTVSARNVNTGPVIDKSRCLTLPAGQYGRYECGYLRLSYALPATKTLGRTWTPTLVYSSEHAYPIVTWNADVGIQTSETLDSVRVIASVPSWGTFTRTVSLPNDGQPRRVVIEGLRDLDNAWGGGVFHYTLTAEAWKSGSLQATASDTGTVLVVDRRNGQFGSGWWLSGLESIVSIPSNPNAMMWIGGDGSARVYSQVGSSSVWVVTPTLDRPDTLLSVTSGGVTTWQRRLPNSAYVEFDNAGRHITTVNAKGYRTRFTYSGGSLDSLILPVPSTSTVKRAYKFQLFVDTVITYPGPQTSISPRVRVTAPSTNGNPRITDLKLGDLGQTFVDPRGLSVTYGIDGSIHVITSRTGRDGNQETYTYFSNKMLTSVGANSSSGYIETRFCAAELASVATFTTNYGCGPYCNLVTGCGGWRLPSDVRTVVDGPRTDVDDTTRFAVNQFGAPTLIRDALGNQTSITYGDSRFPALVTSITHPGGFTQQQAYNARGLVDSSVAVNPLGDGRNAITKYTWHATRPLPTQTIDPTGGVTQFGYDSVGNRIWQQTGSSSSSRVNFAYDSDNRITYVQPPNHSTSQRVHLEYDALLGNLSRETTPIGFYTTYTTDSIGRVIAISSPSDSAGARRLAQTLTYDSMDRLMITQTSSMPTTPYSFPSISGNATSGAAIDSSTYDGEGRLVQQTRLVHAFPVNHTLSAHTYSYDASGRRIGDTGPGGWITDSLDQAGNIVSHTGGVTMSYDAIGRLTRRITPGSQHGESCHPMLMDPNTGACPSGSLAFPMYGGSQFVVPTDTATFTYDARGNVLTANNVDGRINRSYYPNGQLKTDTLRIRTYTRTANPTTDFASHVFGLAYEYDLSGRRTKLYHPASLAYGCGSSCAQTYAYDTLTGRLTGTASVRGQAFAFGYDDAGNLISSAGPGGTQQSYTYDLDGRLVQRIDRRGLSTADTVHHDFLSLDATGRVVKDTTTGLASLTQAAYNAYDVAGQLVATEYDQLSPHKVLTEEWTLDALGNPTNYVKNRGQSTINSRTNTFQENTSQLVSSDGTDPATYTYDLRGRQDQTATSSQQYTWSWYAGNGTTYGFQRQGPDTTPKMRSVLDEYRYDALGRRILVRSRAASTCTAAFCKSAIERYVWDGNQKLYEIRVPGDNSLSSAALEADTATGPFYGRMRYLTTVGGTSPLALDRDGLVVMPHMNWRGLYDTGTDTLGQSCCTTIDWVGKDQAAYLDGALVRNPTGWGGSLITGQQDQSGLMYRLNRYYDPANGRFTQTDPIGIAGGVNQYGFAGSDPVNYGDPYGLLIVDSRGVCTIMAASCGEGFEVWAAQIGANTGGGGIAGPLPGTHLTAAQIEQLGSVCTQIDCTRITVLSCPQSRSFTIGYAICMGTDSKCSLQTLAHETFHVSQWVEQGAGEYFRRGINDREQEWFGPGSPYDNPKNDPNSLEPQAQAYGNQFSGSVTGCSW
jgi:RHS repeat-associated protein